MPAPTRLDGTGLNSPVQLCDVSGNVILTVATTGYLTIAPAAGRVGFYGTTPTAQLTGVAVTAGGIHAALVTLGLITA